jgi:hypothetical protein
MAHGLAQSFFALKQFFFLQAVKIARKQWASTDGDPQCLPPFHNLKRS